MHTKDNVLEVSNMNRQKRRSQNRLLSWVDSLSKDKQEIIEMVVMNRANNLSALRLSELQTDISAAIISLHPNISVNDIQRILVLANEYSKKSENFINKYGRDWIKMIRDKNEIIKKEMKKLYESGVKSQNSIVKSIKKTDKFKEIPQKDIVIIWKEFKTELEGEEIKKIDKDDKKIKDALNYIFKEEKEVKEIEENEEMKIKGQTIPKELETSVKEEIKTSNDLTILEKRLKVKGKYNCYEVENNIVSTGEREFKSIKEVEEYKKEKIEELINSTEEIKAVFNII